MILEVFSNLNDSAIVNCVVRTANDTWTQLGTVLLDCPAHTANQHCRLAESRSQKHG